MEAIDVRDGKVMIGRDTIYVYLQRRLAMNGKPREISVQLNKSDLAFDRMLVTTNGVAGYAGIKIEQQPKNADRHVIWQGIIDEARSMAAAMTIDGMQWSDRLGWVSIPND